MLFRSVKAKFLRKSPFIAGFRRFLSHWYGYVLLIALPLLIVGVLFIVGYVKDKIAAESEKATSLDDISAEEKQKLLEAYLNETAKQEDAEEKDEKYADDNRAD